MMAQVNPNPASRHGQGQNELNQKVARLCGWKCVDYSAEFGPLWWVQGNSPLPVCRLPDYCNDLNACAELIDMLADKGWNCALGNGLDKTWECEFYRPARLGSTHPDNLGIRDGKSIELHYGSADTMPLAICDAFVRTMEAGSASMEGANKE